MSKLTAALENVSKASQTQDATFIHVRFPFADGQPGQRGKIGLVIQLANQMSLIHMFSVTAIQTFVAALQWQSQSRLSQA